MGSDGRSCITYFRIVTRDTVCIALMMVALHNLEFKEAHVLNAYMTTFNDENMLTVLGPEFGDDAGKPTVMVRAFHGLKVQVHLSEHILHNVYRSYGMSHVRPILTCD